MLLFKYETLKNSYLVFDPARAGYAGKVDDPDFLSWASRMCDVHAGIGSNGLLFGPFWASGRDFEFRVVNSNGSFAEFSGNGARIFGQYLLDAGYVAAGQTFSFFANSQTGARIKIDARQDTADPTALVTDLNVEQKFGSTAVEAGPDVVTLDKYRISVPSLDAIGCRMGFPQRAWCDSSPLSIGNPHCVTFVSSPDLLPSFEQLKRFEGDLSGLADGGERDQGKVFAQGCNLQWAFVVAKDTLLLRIVERGEGPTMASGSSASAATIAAWQRGLIDQSVEVVMPGGSVTAQLNVVGSNISGVVLTARATKIAEIQAVR